MDTDPGTIGTIVAAVLAAFGAKEGIGFYIGRRRAQNEQEQSAGNTNPGLGNTGPVATLDIVTDTECRESRREIVESIGKQTGEIQSTLKEQTRVISGLTISVTRMEGKLETATADNDRKLAEHIATHHRKGDSLAPGEVK